jgi:phospholipid-binding lipoprotein MlaA
MVNLINRFSNFDLRNYLNPQRVLALFRNRLGILLGISVFVFGCAAGPHHADPLEKFNRNVFVFNDSVDQAMLKPVAKGYKAITPAPIDQGITNFFSNLNDVVVVGNDLLQFKLKQTAADMGRLLLNSTVGVIGFIDVATKLGLPKHEEDFGQTLGYWGLKSGPYVVLPFFGPSSVRDMFGKGVDIFLDPRVYYAHFQGGNAREFVISTNVISATDTRADLLDIEKILQTAALDKYSYIRDAYLARRQYLVYDGNLPQQEQPIDEDELFDDLEENNEADNSATEDKTNSEEDKTDLKLEENEKDNSVIEDKTNSEEDKTD